MKKILLLTSGILILLLIGFYLYSTRKNSSGPILLTDLVPADAILLYENRNPTYPKKNTQDLATQLRRYLRQDSIFISPQTSKNILLSFHITGKEDFGIVYYLPDTSIFLNPAFRKLTHFPKQKRRIFERAEIIELTNGKSGTFACATINNTLVISHEAILIEDVIRSYGNEEKKGFRENNKQLFQLIPDDAGQGKLYGNLSSLTKFCSTFLSEEIKNNIFKNLGNTLISDAKIDNQTLSLNGFASDSINGKISALSLFNGQHPVTSEIRKIVSNHALIFVHYGISDFPSWTTKRKLYTERNSPQHLKEQQAAENKTGFKNFYSSLGDEAGQCYMNPHGQPEEIFMLEIKSTAATKMITLLSGTNDPIENYASYQLYKTSSSATITNLLWPMTENTKLRFYTLHDQYLLFAETTEVLKSFITDIEEDNTLGKSADWNTFLNSTPLEANFSCIFNGATLTPWILKKLAPRWDSVNNPHYHGSFQKGSIQFSRLHHNYYFNGLMEFDSKKNTTSKNKLSSTTQITFSSEVNHLTVVKNHNNNTPELLVQTTDKDLILLAADFKTLFKVALNDKITGQVYQIDYLRNRKLQYLFLAGQSLHLIDRLGNNVKGFPVTLQTTAPPQYLSLIDYDNTRNYRFLVTDQNNTLYMLDKEGKPMEGWTGKEIKSKLFNAPRAVRDGTRDFIVAADIQGNIFAFNRKGEMVKGFPVASGIKPHGDWFFEKLPSENVITIVNSEGAKAQVNLKGRIVNKENYVRSSPDSKFSLITTAQHDEYFISRVDKGKIAIIGKKGELVFEQENPGADILEAALLPAANGDKLFCFRDTQQEFSYIFNEKGNSVFANPLESSRIPVAAKQAKEGLTFFVLFNSQLKKVAP